VTDDDGHPRANAPFDEVWKTLRLDAVRETLQSDRTLTVRGLAALRGDSLSVDVDVDAASADKPRAPKPPLPRIPIDDHRNAKADGATSRVADFEIVDTLGEGGMGRVHLARQRSLERDVAIKTMKAGQDPLVADLLFREAVFAGGLEHPSIIPIHAIGRDDEGRPVLVMKRVDGVSWHALLRDDAHPAWARVDGASERLVANINILMQVCNAIELAHQRGIVHRDIKPANVMVGELGEVYLLDFGIATRIDAHEPERSSLARFMVGTPAYMSPEMVIGDKVDARTDVYLLGSTLHEVLTKRRRHEGADVKEILCAAFESAPFDYGKSTPAELAELANAATSLDRARRPESALAFKQALQRYLAHRGSLAFAQAAELRLTEARASADDEQRAHELLTESRFGFTQALREWADNQQARRGLRACLVAMIEREISTEDVAGARALLRELGEASPELDAKIAALEASLRKRREQGEELRHLRRDFDPKVAVRSTRAFFFMAGAVLFALSAMFMTFTTRDQGGPLTGYAILSAPFIVLATLGTTVAVFRKRVLLTALSRRIVTVVIVSTGLMGVNHVVGALMHTVPAETLPTDILIMAASTAAVAITTARIFFVALPIEIAAYVFARLVPEHTLSASSFAMAFLAAFGGVLGLREEKG
jgi:serine/threonine-protein kinase